MLDFYISAASCGMISMHGRGYKMDSTRSNVTLYALAGIAAVTMPALLFDGTGNNPLQLPSLAPTLIAIALLARTSLKQLDAAHSLSTQLNKMIEHKDIRHLIVPTPGSPEINAIGHQLNVLIHSLSAPAGSGHPAGSRTVEKPGEDAPDRPATM
jgi:hypothetical protein